MVTESEKSKHDMLRAMRKHIRENGKVVTDEMIADWESALERDEWPSGWVNVGEVVEGKSTGVFIREEVEPVDGFTSEKGIGTWT